MATEKLKQAALLIVQIAQQADSLPKDGFQLTDAFAFFPQLSQIPAILKDKEALIAQFKSVTSAEINELVVYVEQELVLTNKRTEEIIEKGLEAIASIYAFVNAIRPKAEEQSTQPV